MHPQDTIVTALTPGTPFNPKGLIYRSVISLAEITNLPYAEVLGLLAGDLAGMVSCKPSKKGKGLLVALKANIPPEVPAVVPVVEGEEVPAVHLGFPPDLVQQVGVEAALLKQLKKAAENEDDF